MVLLEIMLKRVQAHISTVETQQVSMTGNSAVHAFLVKFVINTSKRCQKVCDGLRGDACVAAQEVGFENLCEIVERRPRGVDTLIQPRARNGFSLD